MPLKLWPFGNRRAESVQQPNRVEATAEAPLVRGEAGANTLSDLQAANKALVEKRFAEAISLYERHAAAHPGDAPRCFTKIAEAYRRTNIVKEPVELEPGVKLIFDPDRLSAERSLRRALEINPDYFPALQMLSEVLPEDAEERVDLLERALAIRIDLKTLLHLAKCYVDRQMPQRAYELYLRAREHNPLDGTAYEGLLTICRGLGNEDEARQWEERWKEAYARKPRVDGKGRSA